MKGLSRVCVCVCVGGGGGGGGEAFKVCRGQSIIYVQEAILSHAQVFDLTSDLSKVTDSL